MLDNGYVSINTIIARIKQNPYIKEDFNKVTTINLIGQALRMMNTKEVMEHAVELVDIDNFKGDIPEGLKRIVQTGYRMGKDFKMERICREDCCECSLAPIKESSNYYVNIENNGDCANGNCNKIIIEKKFYERKSYLPVINILDNYNAGAAFRPIYPTVNNFGIYMYDKMLNPNYDSKNFYDHSYMVTDYALETSFKEGQLLISFFRTPLDDEGYPLIPNDEFVMQCCEKYYYYKNIGWKVISGMDPSLSNLYVKLEQDFNESLVKVKGKSKMPNREQLQLGYKYMNTLLPNDNKFNNYFGYF